MNSIRQYVLGILMGLFIAVPIQAETVNSDYLNQFQIRSLNNQFHYQSMVKGALVAGATAYAGSYINAEDGLGLAKGSFSSEAVNTVAGAGIDTAVNGGSFSDNLVNATIDTVGANVAGKIGKSYGQGKLNYMEHKLVHALAGGAIAELRGDDFVSGAAGAAVGEAVAEYVAAIGFGTVGKYAIKAGKKIVQNVRSVTEIEVLNNYNPLNKGPLPNSIVQTFRSGTYSEVVTTEPIKLYRAISDNGNSAGAYWTRTKPQGSLTSVIDNALDQNWGNTATRVVEMDVPAGTKLFEGVVAPQRGLVGGGNQIYFDKSVNPLNPKWIK